jgi:hypothetical protein
VNKESDLLPLYLEHLRARLRARQQKPKPQNEEEDLDLLPSDLSRFCSSNPRACLDLILLALEQVHVPELVGAVGDELLENLLNEHSQTVQTEVAHHLRTNRRFRQAFACGTYSSVDPAVISEWVNIFQELGTTKQAERKSLRRTI